MRGRRVLWLGAAAGFAFALAAAGLWAAGIEPGLALSALVAGAAGDGARIGVTLLRATPLALAGLAVVLAFRAGLWNIGAEGQLVVGALAAAWVGGRPELPGGFMLALLASGVAGALWGGVAGVLRAALGVPEVISTILLNFIALELRSWLVLGPLREAAGQYPQSDAIAPASWLRALGPVPGGLVLAVVLALLLHGCLFRSRAGLALRATGGNPHAAAALGVRVGMLQVSVLALSGALAGLAGGSEILGSIHRVFEGYAPGHGYTAIAVALLADLQPLGALLSALLFGALQAGAERMELVAQVPLAVSLIVQAAVVLGSVLARRSVREERS